MKMTCNKRQQMRTLFVPVAAIVWIACAAGAAQGPYDLDLKELRRPQVRRDRDQGATGIPKRSVSSSPTTGGESSSYTVRQGDHLFLILMQRYGLSNNAAERLIPEIMRLNGIRKPEGLSVGQRLIIPLPPAKDAAAKTPSQSGRKSTPPPPESAAAPPQPTDTLHVREIAVTPSHPCLLARDVAQQLGAIITALPPFIDADGINVSYDVRKMAVICGLESAEAYTLERLLSRLGVKLLLFKDDEAPRAVIEGVAGGLGIPFRLSTADAGAELPLTFLFPAAIDGNDLTLIFRADLPVLE